MEFEIALAICIYKPESSVRNPEKMGMSEGGRIMSDNHRILIVEDEEGLALHLAFLLERMNFIPLDPVSYAEEAVACAGEQKPSLVLMDINLAGSMDGIEAARLIRDQFNIPVIFLSGMSEDDTVESAQSSEPYGYLVKPVKETDLRIAIEMALYKHQMEVRLRDSEQRYRLLFEKMSNGFGLGETICDSGGQPVDFRILGLNPAFERMIGAESSQLLGKTVIEALPDFDSAELIKIFGRTALSGEPSSFEYHLKRINQYLNFTVYSPGQGQFAAIVEDITERRRAEMSLQESETRFRQLAEGVREVFWLFHGKSGQMLYVSPAYEQVFGRSREELFARPGSFFDQVYPEDQLRVYQAQAMLIELGAPFEQEYRVCLTNGSLRWIRARIFPVLEGKLQTSRYSGFAEDITERRQAEEQLRKSYTDLERSFQRLSTLLNIDLAVTTHTDQANMAQAILSHVIGSGEIDAAVLFVPNTSAPGRLRNTGPLGLLRMAGLVGLPESVVDSSVLNWQMMLANQAYQTTEPYFLNDLRQDPHPGAQILHRMTGFLTSAILPLLDHGQIKGVLQFLSRQMYPPDSDWKTFFQSLALQMAIGLDQVEMLESLKRSNRELALAYEETVKGWGQALELRDLETRGHTDRVSRLAHRLAETMGIREPDLTNIRLGALLHDVGKMAIPDALLLKPGPLNQEEWVIMRQHTSIAYKMLYNIAYLRPALDVVYAHHEKWDGTGYPRGLSRESIPLSARIFAVVDVWDALTSDRPYHLAWPQAQARAHITAQSGKHFDPRVVQAFLRLI